jgi:multisubunit Na+/H+ antiporter MnhE subunit
MKTYRLIALAASVLINVLAARVLVNENVGAPADPTQPAITVVP